MNQLVAVTPAFTVSDVERVALAIAKGGLFGSKDPNAVLTLCLLAQAEGQHPAVVFRDYHIISGKPAKKAEAMLRDFIQAGGKVEWHTLTDDCADATFTHPSGSARISWDHARVVKAQLGGNGMYKKFPRQMLRSRVISEGIRTVYPGATSGLYEQNEVEAIVETAPISIEAPANETAGEFVDAETGEVTDGHNARDPAIPGITKIRNNLNKLRRDGGKATTLEAFNDLVHGCKDDLQKIKDAGHSLWTGMGEDFDGFRAWIKTRREELEGSLAYQLLVSTLNEIDTPEGYKAWLEKNGDTIGDLDGKESRDFEIVHDTKMAILGAMATAQHETREAAANA